MDARLARLIQIVRGRMVMFSLALETDRELLDWLTGNVPLPSLPELEGDGGQND
jgi:hypothetical protein